MRVRATWWPSILVALVSTAPARAADEPSMTTLDAKLLALHQDEAKRWDIFLDAPRTKKAEFVSEPVYRWTNAARANGQSGALFVSTFEGRPVALGGVFSNPEGDRRVIMHELHAVGERRLFPYLKDSDRQWRPTAGVPLLPLPEAPAPGSTAARRARQMRDLARQFTAHTVDDRGQRWQLRLLSRPLYRYDMAGGDVIEGGVFGFVSDAGTDPEIVLILEAVKSGDKSAWRCRTVRFSISSLYVQFKGKDLWTSPRDRATGAIDNPDNTYGLIRDRLIDELPELRKRREGGS